MRAKCRPWTDEELAKATKLHAEGKASKRIDQILGRPIGSTHQKLAMRGYLAFREPTAPKPEIPPEAAIDRDARYVALARRTVGQSHFGDPPPGYSALDRMD